MKWCPDCDAVKPIDQFPRNRSAHGGRAAYCKICHNARGKASRDKVGGSRTYHLKRRYGLTAEQVDKMIEAQGGKCAACSVKEPKHVDHDHETGVVRGILCFTCNVALGNAKDEIATLRGLVAYLRRHGDDADDPSARVGRWRISPGVWRVQLPDAPPSPVPV